MGCDVVIAGGPAPLHTSIQQASAALGSYTSTAERVWRAGRRAFLPVLPQLAAVSPSLAPLDVFAARAQGCDVDGGWSLRQDVWRPYGGPARPSPLATRRAV